MTTDDYGVPSEDDLDLLCALVDYYRNVPPGREEAFRILDKIALGGQPGGRVLLHSGFEQGEVRPDWAALRRLADAGFLRFGEESSGGYLQTYSYDTVEITETGFQAADEISVKPPTQNVSKPQSNEVWVVYGRNRAARDLIFNLLRAAGLEPLDFDHVGELTGSTSPYIGDVLEAAFARAQAFLVLLTDDEEVCLREELRTPEDPDTVEYQARPNVIFEAGMGMALHPDRTIIVEMGSVRRLTDLSGRHAVRWRDGDYADRHAILKKLHTAGCPVQFERSDWATVGVGTDLKLLRNPVRRRCGSTTPGVMDSSSVQSSGESPPSQLTSLVVDTGNIADRVKVGWSTEHDTDKYRIQGAQQILTDADSLLETIRLSKILRDRPTLHKSIDEIRKDFKRLIRDNPPKNEFRIREFWWQGDEAIERLEAFKRMLDVMVGHGLDPIDGLALKELRSQKACIFLVDDAEHRIAANLRSNSYLLVTIPIRNEGGAIARSIKMSSATSELNEVQAHPEGEIDRLEPEEDGELWFAFLPSYPEGSKQAHESRFRLRIDFRDGLGNDSVGYVIRLRDAGNRTFRGWVIPERTVASPFCPRLAFDFRASGEAQ